MRQAEASMKDGVSLVVFPEGASTFTGHMGYFKRGAFQLADELQLAVVPVTIDGSFEILPRTGKWIHRHRMVLTIHEPIAPKGQGAENIKATMTEAYAAVESSLPEKFKGMDPLEVAALIEGIPYISTVPVELGLTNAVHFQNGKRIVGFNTENQELNEGLVRFDIVFYVRMKDGLSQLIINVEALKDEPGEYEILNRAVFYVSRLISSQKERDFENSSYDDIKCVYSIWIC